MNRIDIKSLPLEQLRETLANLGEPAYRGAQVYQWLHQKHVADFSQMTNLPASLREKLEKECYINLIKVKKRLVSAVDGTVKYLYELTDGQQVETVLMRHHHGESLCVSTQVGCRMGCRFCASTIGGLQRNLTPAEMLDQVYESGRDLGRRIGHLVLMGIGEPLDNLPNALDFLTILSSREGLGLSLRHVSLSTCGLVDGIDELSDHRLPLTLSVSLHASDDASRSRIMPVNRRYPIGELLEACRRYFRATGRRVTFEYALIAGENDSAAQADQLADLLLGLQSGGAGMPCHVNLIPVNPVRERDYRRSAPEAVRRFQQRLQARGVNATVRRELGGDISAACGQLRRDSD